MRTMFIYIVYLFLFLISICFEGFLLLVSINSTTSWYFFCLNSSCDIERSNLWTPLRDEVIRAKSRNTSLRIYFNLSLQVPLNFILHKRPRLAFKNNTPQLQRLQLMPHILRDVNPIVATLLTQHHIFYDRAIIIVSSHSNLASQDNERLILRWVPMDGHYSPRLHRIQHPMALVFQRLVEALCRDHAQ